MIREVEETLWKVDDPNAESTMMLSRVDLDFAFYQERREIMEEKDRINFIDSLELADIEESKGDNPRAAYVCGGSTVSFAANVSSESQSDVLNSTLFAQLGANHAHDRENDAANWYRYYQNVLVNIGWMITDFKFTKFNATSESFSMDKVITDLLLAANAARDEIAIANATIDALKALPQNDGRLRFLESMSHSASKGNFQISVAHEGVSGDLTMRMVAAYFSTSDSVTNVLWFPFTNSKTNMYTASQEIILNSLVYSQFRDSVAMKLGSKAGDFVKELPISG